MVIGDVLGYSSLGLGGVRTHRSFTQEQNAVTLEAKLDPKIPNAYSVQVPAPTIPPPEKASDVKPAIKRLNQNSDLVSRAFLTIADYKPILHKIDVSV